MKTLYISKTWEQFDASIWLREGSKPVQVWSLHIHALLAMTPQRMNDVLSELYNQ